MTYSGSFKVTRMYFKDQQGLEGVLEVDSPQAPPPLPSAKGFYLYLFYILTSIRISLKKSSVVEEKIQKWPCQSIRAPCQNIIMSAGKGEGLRMFCSKKKNNRRNGDDSLCIEVSPCGSRKSRRDRFRFGGQKEEDISSNSSSSSTIHLWSSGTLQSPEMSQQRLQAVRDNIKGIPQEENDGL